MRPHILISGTEGKMDNYIRSVEIAGGIPIPRYAPMPEWETFDWDGLILCGGGDISPGLYGGTDTGLCAGIDPAREESDRAICMAFWREQKPILGICRGMQMLNVLFGGTLLEDLGELNDTHRGNAVGDRHHFVTAEAGSLLHSLYGIRFRVNSSHHQAVLKPGDGFCVTCRALDGTIEAIESPTLPIFGVQWHPERCAGGETLMAHFVSLCQK